MKRTVGRFILIYCCCLLSSCGFVIEKMAGVRSARPLTPQEHHRFIRKLGASSDQLYYADTNYIQGLNKIYPDSSLNLQRKNHYQPIQVLYYGHSSLASFSMINCYAGGFPKLNWNEGGRFDTYPPLSGAPVDTLFTFERLQQLIRPVNTSIEMKVGSQEPFIAVIYWCRFNFRESKRLHRLVKENLQKSNAPWRILYVNTDRYLAGE